jgi:Protein of unknown function (DUF3307)
MNDLFSAVFVALYVGHVVGDHWVQSDHDARHKGLPGWVGRRACASHVLTLTLTKAITVFSVLALTHAPVTPWQLAAGLTVDAVSHYWADRRTTLAKLAALIPGKAGFYRLGTPRQGHLLKGSTIGDKPIRVMADDNPCLGTGAYALDQSWHIAWLFVASLIIAGGAL